MARFDGKKVLITGGTSGIGLAGAKIIAQEGGTVAITGTNQGRLDAALAALPEGTIGFTNDAGDPQAAKVLAETVKEKMGGVDGIWLNAGFGTFRANTDEAVESFDAMTNVNVRGPVLQMAELIPAINEGGSVVVTASVAPYLGQAQGAVYSATKGAVTALTRSWASDLAPRNIRVNSVAPGPIETNFFDGMGLTDEQVEKFTQNIASQVPLGRFGTSEEAAEVALFLLSDQASYVTGSQFMVDGGMTLR
ncbi:SDR family oxidoreductase [Alterisphingorhabdus coralli]|uniref:SDR family oxidoreductase n=1 Tax=Alterisphingorhabdus coralli TaxID=3071408 RepID=A0AA97F8Q2_9SPHN|nr:SDR family oxidoreductase [Parasphingorhabdus sp. SCSIO 66989]WOE76018.1 SDR family oxidoreductase [Parasphingorhabdus sp. SCSIO 66989]